MRATQSFEATAQKARCPCVLRRVWGASRNLCSEDLRDQLEEVVGQLKFRNTLEPIAIQSFKQDFKHDR